jgi:L-asparaginase
MKDILIINTGGTFNKVYDEIKGELVIPKSSKNLKKLVKKAYKNKIKVEGMIYKDSLAFTNKDRKKLLQTIQNSEYKKIVVIHGTDTIDVSAEFIAKNIKNKQVIFTGAMKPVFIDETEGIANLSLAIGFLNADVKNGIYIAMHGMVKSHDKIFKNRKLGIFQERTKILK